MQETLFCPHASRCPGCPSIAVPYDQQLNSKLAFVRNTIREKGLRGFDAGTITTIHPSPMQSAYRNRARLAPARSEAGQLLLGLYALGTHDVVDIPECPIHLDDMNETIELLRELTTGIPVYDETTHQGCLRYISVRQSRRTGKQLVGLVTSGETLPNGQRIAQEALQRNPRIAGVVQNINTTTGNAIFGSTNRNLGGSNHLVETVCGIDVCLGLTSFFQINTDVAELAYKSILRELALSKADTVLDLYCGIGAIGLVTARHAARVFGVESDKEAVFLAEQSAQRNGIDNATFIARRAESWLESHEGRAILDGPGRLAVALNPPRKGLDPVVIEWLGATKPSRVAYLSCAPHSLARDLKLLCDRGFHVEKVDLFDMFPQTEQVETLAILGARAG